MPDNTMRKVIKAKFDQFPNLRALLLKTNNTELIEDSTDSYWGTGEEGNGKNRLGFLLMELRSIYKGEAYG